MPAGGWLRQAWRNAHSKPLRLMSIARMRFWLSSLPPQPARYIIHRKDGFIHVMRFILNGGDTNRPAASAASAMASLYA